MKRRNEAAAASRIETQLAQKRGEAAQTCFCERGRRPMTSPAQATIVSASSFVCLTLLAACGDGGSSGNPKAPGVPPETEPVSASGVISALLGAVTVNGVRYQTPETTVAINGQPGSFLDLELGQFVSVGGSIEVEDSRGTADRIEYEAHVIGPVEGIDAGLSQLLVMGQTVLTDAKTVFDSRIDPSSLAPLTVGSKAQVSGFLNADGEIVATLVKFDTASTGVQVLGRVAGLDLDNMLFTVNRLTVDYSGAVLVDLPDGMPAESLFVVARGSLANGILIVDEMESLHDSAGGIPGERAQAHGAVTRFDSPMDFDLNGFPVTAVADTSFVNGTINDLRANAQITVDGRVTADGGSIVANEIVFGRVADTIVTETFDLSNFTEISVFGVFKVTIAQAPDFLVKVTIDEDEVDDLDITRTGSRLNIGLAVGDHDIQTLDAVVTLPVLDGIRLNGSVNVTLSGFDQAQLKVDVAGISRLHADSLRISDLTASVVGVSQLDFGDTRPLANAKVDVEGISRATLNMDVDSALTGSVMGTSILFYYGTDVALNVTTDFNSSTIKLGATRP